jgi:hypothetical protein
VAGLSKINKRGGYNKACSWENYLKKNKKNSTVIRDFRVHRLIDENVLKWILQSSSMNQAKKIYC